MAPADKGVAVYTFSAFPNILWLHSTIAHGHAINRTAGPGRALTDLGERELQILMRLIAGRTRLDERSRQSAIWTDLLPVCAQIQQGGSPGFDGTFESICKRIG
jgi:hypothetical protein